MPIENYKRRLSGIYSGIFHPIAFMRLLKESFALFYDNELLRLANAVKTDKGIPGHGYVRVYDSFLKRKKNQIKYLCEIGLLHPKFHSQGNETIYDTAPSLRMWKKYLPNTKIIGFDIQRFKKPSNSSCTIIQGDQSSREDLSKILQVSDVLDVVIDDALHASKHQQITLSYLFKHLSSNGLYFIEDLQYQPELFESEGIPKTIRVLKEFQSTGIWSSPFTTKEEKEYLESHIRDIYFFDSLERWGGVEKRADSIAVLVKK